jgi:hypothetical protein
MTKELKFKVGDTVRCITPGDSRTLVKGKVYEVAGYDCNANTPLVKVKGVDRGYYEHRFELAGPDRNAPYPDPAAAAARALEEQIRKMRQQLRGIIGDCN